MCKFCLEKASPQISGLSRSMRLSSEICGLGFLWAKLAQLELANSTEICLQDIAQLARTGFSPKWLRFTVAILAQAASYCPTRPHLYRYLGRRLGRYTFLQPLLSIRPGEGVQVSGGTWCPRKHVPPSQNFLDGAGVFPFWCLSPGVFLPFGLLPPTGLVPFSG